MSYRVSVSTDVPQPDEDDAQELAEQFASVCRRTGKWNTFDSTRILNYFELTTHLLLLAKIVDKRPLLAGFLLLICPEGGTTAEIKLVCVAESQKGQGLSKRLIDKAKEVAKAAGKTEIELEREGDDSKLIKVYTDQGFKDVEGRRGVMTAMLGGLRLHKQTRRAHRNRRNLKHRKLRKLSTRRR